jgi:His Kinase A (phospho-acceptor) domain
MAATDRRRFLQRLDHELKNPLTAIRAGLANVAEAPSPQAAHSVDAQVLRLSRLTADLRQLAELETRPLERAEVDLSELLTQVFELAQARGREPAVEAEPAAGSLAVAAHHRRPRLAAVGGAQPARQRHEVQPCRRPRGAARFRGWRRSGDRGRRHRPRHPRSRIASHLGRALPRPGGAGGAGPAGWAWRSRSPSCSGTAGR